MSDTSHEVVPSSLAGERVDRVVALFTELPRAMIADMLANGSIRVDGKVASKPSQRVVEGQELDIDVPALDQKIPEPDDSVVFDVLYSDDDIVIVDKPAGLVVHPGAGHTEGTLVHGLLAKFPDIAANRPGDPMRSGIVHRLDAGTSGLIVVARTQAAYESLVEAMKTRSVERHYLALAWGNIQPDNGMIDAPIGRAQGDRTKMAVSNKGKEARTRYEVVARHVDPVLSLVAAQLDTGRTHQIRVHLAAIHHPVVGDGRYGGNRQGLEIDRPFLHARTLRLAQPRTGEQLSFESPIPADLAAVLDRLGMSLVL